MIRAAFFDIDGTLVSLDTHRIPQSAHRALELLRQKGVRLFICSGRPYCAIDNLEGEKFDGFITVNGGICSIDGKTILKRPIPQSDMDSWNSFLKHSSTDCFFITEDRVYMNRRSKAAESFIDLLHFITPQIAGLDELSGTPIYQMVGLFTEEYDSEIIQALPGCRMTRWHPTFSDIIPADSDKSHGMRAILDYLGMKADECIAFGDGTNDLGMLRYAGTSVAMGGCCREVAQASDYITGSPDEDGILNALKHYSII